MPKRISGSALEALWGLGIKFLKMKLILHNIKEVSLLIDFETVC